MTLKVRKFSQILLMERCSVMRLHNKVAIITGGSQGIGKAVAFTFSKEGAKVVIVARTESILNNTVDELRKISSDVVGVVGDVSKPGDVKKIFAETEKRFQKNPF